MAAEYDVKKALEQCAMVQSMIDISADHLEGLRTQCATSAELTQQEIRTLEGKLIKLFSRQLLFKARLRENDSGAELKQYPQLKQWLDVVGLRRNSAQGVLSKVKSVEELMRLTDRELKNLLHEYDSRDEEERRLIVALQNLRKCTECLRQGEKDMCNELDLHWDSWDQVSSSGNSSPKPRLRSGGFASVAYDAGGGSGSGMKSYPSSPPMTSSVPNLPWSPVMGFSGHGHAAAAAGTNFNPSLSSHPPWDRRFTPPPTPPTSSKKGEKMKFPTTPPPRKRHQTGVTNLLPDSYPLTKSKSHESQLANRVNCNDSTSRSDRPARRGRLLTEPGLDTDQEEVAMVSTGLSSSLTNSPMRVSPHSYVDHRPAMEEANHRAQLVAPTSPRTPTFPHGVPPQVSHRFKQIIKVAPCDICKKQMIIGFKCKECKLRCHHNCSDKSNTIPCLTPEFLNLIRMHNDGNRSPILARISSLLSSPGHKKDGHRDRRHYPLQQLTNAPFQAMDTSSNTSSSSCNSSTPSSPAPNSIMHTPPILTSHHFDFADIPNEKCVSVDSRLLTTDTEMVETQKSNDSDKTMSGTSGSTDSEKTLAGRVDSQDSQMSDVDSIDRSWPRQNSLSFREWEILYNELVFGEPVGSGRFGTVYKGHWHGEVAIKVFNTDQMDDEKALDAFKQDVATFRKTRHENLILFMGACMKPPHLAIVTRLCKAMTLYTHVHLRHNRFNLNRAIIIAQQVSQGMGYLHARGIVHKDLKTKNIFLENGKVVITDFGLFSVTKLCHGNRKGDWLSIPPGWLCYLAPEIVSCLRASNDSRANDDIPFTKTSDVYAFGTVWYELLCGEWPFKGQPPESIIWQVGKGMKQSLANIQASRDVKDILMMCWAYKPSERPEFSSLPKLLEKLPKKRLARSPSHPVQLSRSAESVF